MASRAAYGENPNAGVSVNADHGWGGHQWPAGVPSELLGTAEHHGVRVIVRRELTGLFEVAFRIAEAVGYRIHTRDPGGSGESWGPWSYQNRAIGGTQTPSNHSRGKAIDVNAPHNPFSPTFICDMPVEMVNAWERIGLCWGGRYTGQKFDTMHFEYGYSPGDVAAHVALGNLILTSLGADHDADTEDAPVLGADGGWPLPPGDYFGPVTGPDESHSGDSRFDNRFVRNCIKRFQHELNSLGYAAGPEDGIFGPLTGAATRAWQTRNGRAATAVCSRADWDAIHADDRLAAPPVEPRSRTLPPVTAQR